ncbi:MAG: hypothetical protein QW175_06955 [Candidatus Bathyarchaeia archaeon]
MGIIHIKIRVEEALKPLMLDQEFRRRVIAAYHSQVEANGGWGFTVRYKDYRIRFDIDAQESCRGLIVYKGYAEDQPKTVQKTLLEAYT